MKNVTYLLMICFAGMIIHSCTITKRHFGNGYHVEWRKKPGDSGFETSTFQEIDSKREVLPSPITSVDEVQTRQTEMEAIKPVSDTNSEKVEQPTPKINPYSEEKDHKQEQLENPGSDYEIIEGPEQKIYPLTWFMMGTLTLIVVSYVLGMLTSYLFMGGIIGFAFIGLILGIISLIAVKRHPENYKAKKLTKFFALFCIISGGVIVYGALLYFIAMNN